ncbi:phage tail protein [Clostridium sp. LQ25]|uniref:phage tail protein n=1 Tax=Clostridium sp. LQ25 TaxID=2992805 RepID=UPI00225B045C|nr:phage tail protein [Clostridium sp. LQ25]UZT05301.1 phage tail protein [Clostridium sp. LQ25]
MKKKIIASLLVSLSVVGILPVSAQAAWKKDAYNNNVWVEAGGIKQGWNFIDNFWYYLGADGVPVTGWLQDKGDWYYMWSNGTMAYNTWMTNGGLWYYFDENGKMVTDLVKVESREYDFTNTAIILSKNIGLDNTKNIPQTAEKTVSDIDVSSVVSGEGK